MSTLFVSNLEGTSYVYHQVLLDTQRRFQSRLYLDILYTFLCNAERTSTSVAAEPLHPPNKINSALSHTEIADGVLKSLHAVLYTENDKVLSYHNFFSDFIFDQNRAKKFWCDQAKHYRLLSDSCFRVMDCLKFNITNIESSFLLDWHNSAPRADYHSYLELFLLELGLPSLGYYGKPDCQASKSIAKHLVAVYADDGHH